MSSALECRRVTVEYGDVRALASVDLTVENGETLALLGPSGSGKTTLMYAIAGFVAPMQGEIEISGRLVYSEAANVAPEERGVGLVFQNYALWPHMSAVETVAYPIRRSGVSKQEALARAAELLEMVGISSLGGRRPAELSGGQQQRVGLARALARDVDIYLFDEPTAHLDAAFRDSIQEEIRVRRAASGAAAIYSTHDAAEALAVADRIAILRDGAVIQVGRPREIYEKPVDIWAARLTGPASVITVDVIDGVARLGGLEIKAESSTPDGSAHLILRPEWVSAGGDLNGLVGQVWFRGPHTDYRIETPHGFITARVAGPPRFAKGESAGWSINRGWFPDPAATTS